MNDNVLFEDYLTEGSYNKEFPTDVIVVGYILKSWNVTTIKDQYQDVYVTGTFEEKNVTVTYLDKDGNVLAEETVPYGADALQEVTVPVIEGMEFSGWDKELKVLKEDVTVTATYKASSGCSFLTIKNFFIGLALLGIVFIIRKKH